MLFFVMWRLRGSKHFILQSAFIGVSVSFIQFPLGALATLREAEFFRECTVCGTAGGGIEWPRTVMLSPEPAEGRSIFRRDRVGPSCKRRRAGMRPAWRKALRSAHGDTTRSPVGIVLHERTGTCHRRSHAGGFLGISRSVWLSPELVRGMSSESPC